MGSYLMKVLPTPGPPWQNKAESSGFPPRVPLNHFRYSSVWKSQSPTRSTRWALISWCRVQGSSGDNQARISALSLVLPNLFALRTLLNEIVSS